MAIYEIYIGTTFTDKQRTRLNQLRTRNFAGRTPYLYVGHNTVVCGALNRGAVIEALQSEGEYVNRLQPLPGWESTGATGVDFTVQSSQYITPSTDTVPAPTQRERRGMRQELRAYERLFQNYQTAILERGVPGLALHEALSVVTEATGILTGTYIQPCQLAGRDESGELHVNPLLVLSPHLAEEVQYYMDTVLGSNDAHARQIARNAIESTMITLLENDINVKMIRGLAAASLEDF